MDLILENICKNFGDKKILDNFNLSIKKGEMIAITGESGKGKTTLLNIIGLLESPDSGAIIVNDSVNPFTSEDKKRKLYAYTYGFLFQNYALIPNFTVNENLDIALKFVDKYKRKLLREEALAKVNLQNKADEKVYKLSGGEQQRIALARLMLKPNSIILADEPTGALDEKNRDLVIDLLKEFNKEGKTIVIVTHDKAVANSCDRIIEL